ncbi:porin, partial [Ralstonia pickettii]|nr:porin [Ralstonia pickettii]
MPGNPTGAFDWDRTAGSKPIANSVKFSSPTVAGFSGGVMYAFGGVAGSVGADNAVSAGVNYEIGAFGVGAAYTNEKYGPAPGVPSTSVRNWGVGMHYDFGAVTASALVTTVRNAFNETTIAELTTAFEWLDAHEGVRAIVLAAEGAAFCAGADLNWMKKMAGYSDDENRADARKLARMLEAIHRCGKPVIARVHGDAYAGGVGL